MGHLAHSADVMATRLEVVVLWRIRSAILAALTPLRESIDTLTARVETFESRHGATSKVTASKAEVADLRKEVDYLKSTDFTSLLEAEDDVDTPASFEISPATTGDVLIDDVVVDELEVENDEEQIEVPEETIYGDLADLEKMIVQ
ncbi:hypothetical protein R3W88_033920 [Solanum pinnatisectum]|uniref:Polyprotein protein n=1 Tax=Solanum pinnatisectum TaxID=50273 RepID=A0AAV9K037_9SOLN|nr:hypothetical protein R3W88_033920 [Solanum pinnatisectum]